MLQRLAILCSAAGLVMTVACSQTDTGITTAVKTKLALQQPPEDLVHVDSFTVRGRQQRIRLWSLEQVSDPPVDRTEEPEALEASS